MSQLAEVGMEPKIKKYVVIDNAIGTLEKSVRNLSDLVEFELQGRGVESEGANNAPVEVTALSFTGVYDSAAGSIIIVSNEIERIHQQLRDILIG